MLSPNLKEYIDNNVHSRKRYKLYSLFIDIASSIRHIREHRGISQRKLAEMCNTSYSAIARWESSTYTGYSLSKLVEITDALGCDIEVRIIPREQALNRYNRIAQETWGTNNLLASYLRVETRALNSNKEKTSDQTLMVNTM